MNENKRILLQAGVKLAEAFCDANRVPMPAVEIVPSASWAFDVCAYYRPVRIFMCVERTAHMGTAGRQWSYPGYVTDRTPYGVIAHELGHHSDVCVSRRTGRAYAYWGDYSASVRADAGEPRLTSYCPNDAEWFAEMMRLFITNPDLLRLIRPRTFEIFANKFKPVESREWGEVLANAPLRTIDAAVQKIKAAKRGELA